MTAQKADYQNRQTKITSACKKAEDLFRELNEAYGQPNLAPLIKLNLYPLLKQAGELRDKLSALNVAITANTPP